MKKTGEKSTQKCHLLSQDISSRRSMLMMNSTSSEGPPLNIDLKRCTVHCLAVMRCALSESRPLSSIGSNRSRVLLSKGPQNIICLAFVLRSDETGRTVTCTYFVLLLRPQLNNLFASSDLLTSLPQAVDWQPPFNIADNPAVISIFKPTSDHFSFPSEPPPCAITQTIQSIQHLLRPDGMLLPRMPKM